MKFILRPISLLIALAVLLVIPVSAQRLDKKASGRGDINPATGCPGLGDPNNTPCVVFTSSTTTATYDNFLFGGGEDGPYDLFMVPLTQNVTFQVTAPDPSKVVFGSFLCGDDSSAGQLNGFCANTIDPNAVSDAFLSLNPAALNAANQATFGFKPGAAAGLTSGEWVFFFTENDAKIIGNPTSMPEPSTYVLLAVGLLVLLGAKRLRTQN
jgi:hypothetical protein